MAQDHGVMGLAELHGAATHLAVVAIPLYAVLLLCRRARLGGAAVAGAEPWTQGAAAAGVVLAGATGLLVWGHAQTELRGQAFRLGTAHFWLGIGLALLVIAPAAVRAIAARRGRPLSGAAAAPMTVAAALALAAVIAQGWLGGRETYRHGVGVAAGGQFAATAVGAEELNIALAQGRDPVLAGREAFSTEGLGCARCHGDRAQGLRGPALAGGAQLADFRRVHAQGLFPARVVTDRDFAAIDAWLKTLGRGR